MNREPINTSHKPTTQPSLCSTISKKLCLRSTKGHGEENGSFTAPGQEKAKTNDSTKKNKERKKGNKNEIKIVLKKLKKTTAFLPKALQSPYAYEKGKKSCETCKMDKEAYRSVMKSVKVIELIVDDVINKEQKEMLDKEDEQDVNNTNETVSTKGEKKLSIQFEVYCQKDIDHNLKCVLVKLQKTIGETLLQSCYCKSKKNPDDEKCKKYDVSMNVLEHLKFEYTNLTTSIIWLFKTPPSKQKTPSDVCVACMKEEIVDCTEMLEDMLKNGRNLKVTMRNDDVGKDKCCSRNYPHVHALVQDRHVVLKFELPFEVTPPSQADDKLREGESEFIYTPSCGGCPVDYTPEPIEYIYTTPCDECAEDDVQEPTDEGPHEGMKENSSFPKENSKVWHPENQDDFLGKEKPGDTASLSNKSVKSLQNASMDRKSAEKEPPAESKPLRSGSTASVKEVTPQGSKASKSRSSVHSSPSAPGSSGPTTQDQESPETEKYCGCNFNEVYEKLQQNKNEDVNSQKPKPLNENQDEDKDSVSLGSDASNLEKKENKDINSQKPKPKKRDSSVSDSDESMLSLEDGGSTDSVSPIKKRKQVSFIPDENKQNIFYMGKTNHAVFKMVETQPHSAFQKQSESQEHLSCLPKTSSLNIRKGRESSISAVDSVVLVKNKYSIFGKSKSTKELKQCHSSEKPFFNVPQHETKKLVRLETKMADLERKSSRSLNKQQVSEVLKDLGAKKLLSVSFPAECCKNNITVNEFNCVTDLPFSASLHSLPLDQDDLYHITQAAEKVISNEDIALIPDCDDEWEIQYTDNLKGGKEDKPEWHKAFTARDTASNICIEIQTDKPVARKRIPKIPSQKDIKNLPTIEEEDEEKSRKRVMSKDKSENKGIVNRNKSATSFKTTELRFFTVEYQNVMNKTKTSERDYEGKKAKSKPYLYHHKYHKHLDRYFKINPQTSNTNNIEEVDTGYISDDAFNFCSFPIKSQITESRKICDELSENHLERSNKKCSISPLDEMIMLDVIYLASNDKLNKSFTPINSSNGSEPFTNCKQISKRIPSHGFYRENIKFKNNEGTMNSSNLPSNLTKQTKDSKAKVDSAHQKKQNLKENIYTPLNNYRNYGSSFTVNDNRVKRISENQMNQDVSSSIENFVCNNIKCTVTNSNSHISIETVDDKGKISSNKLDENDINKELTNNSPRAIRSIADITKNRDGKLLNDNKKPYTTVNKEELKTNLNSEILEWNKDTVLNINSEFEGHNLKENLNSKDELKVSFCPKLKTKNNCTHEQNVLLDFDEKEEILQQFSTLNCKHTPIEIKVNLKFHSLNRRSYFICKKPIVKIVEDLNSFKGKTYQKKRKLTLINTGTDFKSLIFKISKPEIKFPRITNFVSSHEIPILVANQKYHDLTTVKDFGLLKSYTSNKNSQKIVPETDLTSGKSVLQNCVSEKNSHGSHTSKNSSAVVEKPPVSNFQATSSVVGLPVSNDKDKIFSPKHEGIFYVFDANGQPLTDSSGRPLRNITGETLLKFDEAGLPLCDFKNSPVFDLSGHSVGEEDFNPVETPYSDILKIISPSGDPMVLYDFGGRPLTSVSGTMLVNCAGEGLLRFGCTGNPASDYRGKPIFYVDGKQVVEYK